MFKPRVRLRPTSDPRVMEIEIHTLRGEEATDALVQILFEHRLHPLCRVTLTGGGCTRVSAKIAGYDALPLDWPQLGRLLEDLRDRCVPSGAALGSAA